MKLFYRISDNSYSKLKISNKYYCFDNFISCFPDGELHIVADNVNKNTAEMLESLCNDCLRKFEFHKTQLGNAGSLIYTIKEAAKSDDIVYLVEDDYLHDGRQNLAPIIAEGLERVDYVTLFDHPDKYESEYGYGEICKCFKTPSTHWRTTISTCMTFATTGKTLREDLKVWERYTADNHPHDHQIFTELSNYRKLGVCIPGLAFHTDITYQIQKNNFDLIDNWVGYEVETQIAEHIGHDFIKFDGYKQMLKMSALQNKKSSPIDELFVAK